MKAKLLMGLAVIGIVVAGGPEVRAAVITVDPWAPIFKGIDLAAGQQQATEAGDFNHRTFCLRIDLTDPGVHLFTTPKCTNCGSDTTAENTSRFRDLHRLQVAVNGAFYLPGDPPLGAPQDVRGLAISEGVVVSPADDASRAATLLFTTNNVPIFIPNNNPGTNTAGIYTAISGDRPLLIGGVVAPAPNPADRDPRTALGISQDRRYLYLMTLDGRQPGWSDGADWYETALWLQRFGAYDGINVDGGGSTTMAMEDCDGTSRRVNRPSYVAAYGRERYIGHNFGVYAPPLHPPDEGPQVDPGNTTAIITWQTDFPGSTRVEYGLTASYGNSTPLDSRLVTQHVATLTGLAQGSNYYFRVVSAGAEGESYTGGCRFTTSRSVVTTPMLGLTTAWRYTTNNLDGANWKARAYDDSGWMGPGPALLYALEASTAVDPKNTLMPPEVAPAPRTYYFRTRFEFTGTTAGVSLTFSNYVDDGAVFYLNGAEVYRLRMPAAPTVINNASTAIGTPCAGTAQSGDAATICPDIFTISGNLLTNLVQGENVIAVSVHNLATGNDIVFGSALLKNSSSIVAPTLKLLHEDDVITLFWNEEGFVLQESIDLSSPANWTDLPSATSPFSVTNSASTFYRLRN
jgi:exopolysaccharide biosynthesis protein